MAVTWKKICFEDDALLVCENSTQNDGLYIATDQIRARDGDGLKLYDDGGNGVFVQNDGNVGIGTTSPGSVFHIQKSGDVSPTVGSAPGSLRIEGAGGYNWAAGEAASEIDFMKDGDIVAAIRAEHDRPGGDHTYEDAGISFYTGNAQETPVLTRIMHIASGAHSGNVGIGTTSNIDSPLSFADALGRKIMFTRKDADNIEGISVSAGQLNYHVEAAAIDHVFYAGGDNGDGTELMRIEGTGNVGIGDTTPIYKLEVNGTAHVTGEFTAGTKTFKIDHPVVPTEKILIHATVEAPRHDLIYRGIAALKNGKVTVDIDAASGMTSGTFAALCQNAVVVSLQNQDGFDRLKPGSISGARFDILCEDTASADKVAWVVMAERKDPLVKWSSQNGEDGHLVVEVNKVEPTADELKVLETKIIETDDLELIDMKTQERVDSLKEKKGYLMQPECRGTTRPYRTIEYRAKAKEAIKK